MKIKFLGALAALFLGGISTALAAGSCIGCKVKNIGAGPYYDGICSSGACVFIDVEETVTGRPACSSNSSWDFVLDMSTASGRSTYALLLSANAAGQLVNIAGTNSCSLSPSGLVENFFYVNLAQ